MAALRLRHWHEASAIGPRQGTSPKGLERLRTFVPGASCSRNCNVSQVPQGWLAEPALDHPPDEKSCRRVEPNTAYCQANQLGGDPQGRISGASRAKSSHVGMRGLGRRHPTKKIRTVCWAFRASEILRPPFGCPSFKFAIVNAATRMPLPSLLKT